jgi:hypothetical protein
MDLRAYYAEIRRVEETIKEPFPVIVSISQGNGGKDGVMTEAERYRAAQAIVDKRSRLATEEEAAAYREKARKAYQDAQSEAAKAKRPYIVLSTSDIEELRRQQGQ